MISRSSGDRINALLDDALAKGQLQDAWTQWTGAGAPPQLLLAAAVKAGSLQAAKNFWSFCTANKTYLLEPQPVLEQIADVVDPPALTLQNVFRWR